MMQAFAQSLDAGDTLAWTMVVLGVIAAALLLAALASVEVHR